MEANDCLNMHISVSSGDDDSTDDEVKCSAAVDCLDLIPKLQSILQGESEGSRPEKASSAPLTTGDRRKKILTISNSSNDHEEVRPADGCFKSLKFENGVNEQVERARNEKVIPSIASSFHIFPRRLYLPRAHELPVKMGNQAITTFRSQQEAMIKSLKDLYASLKNSPKQQTTVQPRNLQVQLLNHQLEGLCWLLWRESEIPSGGVMADDMGLGKTLQFISLILKTRDISEDNHQCHSQTRGRSHRVDFRPEGGTLVVSPSSVLGHWCSEIKRRVKSGILSVYAYHGVLRTRNTSKLTNYDVVLSTYGVVQKEPDFGPIKSIVWDRIILDEAHVIRNHKSRTASSIFSLKARKKWVVTGTPIHNKSEDYYALIKFLGLKPFCDLRVWKKFVGNNHESGHQRLTVINKAIMLRRMKDQIKDSDEKCGLRQKIVKSMKVELDADELLLYEKVSSVSKTIFAQFIQERADREQGIGNKLASETGVGVLTEGLEMSRNLSLARCYNNFVSMGEVKTHEILVLLLRLRQLCCHPSLISCVHGGLQKGGGGVSGYDPAGLPLRLSPFDVFNEQYPNEDRPSLFDRRNPLFGEGRVSSKIRAILSCLRRILHDFVGDKVIIVSQWTSFLCIIEQFVLKELGVVCVNFNGKVPLSKRQGIVDSFNSTSMRHRVLLLSLTAGGVGLNLVGGNHLLFVDLHWNPQLETQASDRIYRFGQTKDVFIYKFICEQTIEERIMRLQQSKLSLAKGILDDTQLKSTTNTLTVEDMKLLFGVEGGT